MFHIRKPDADPPVCGGKTTSIDPDAPKSIVSRTITCFDAASALPYAMNEKRGMLAFLSAFAAPAAGGTFIFLRTGKDYGGQTYESAWALVSEDFLPDLARLVQSLGLAAQNGYHSSTAGLPRNFGGRVQIDYDSGEQISFSDNQTPVLSHDAAEQIAALFQTAMQNDKLTLPDAEDVCAVLLEETDADGGFLRAQVTITPDGTGTVQCKQRFDTPEVYEHEKTLDADAIRKLRETIRSCGMLAWAGLPENRFHSAEKKRLTFRMTDGSEIIVEHNRQVPAAIQNGFFSLELEIIS